MNEINFKMRIGAISNPPFTFDGEAVKFEKSGSDYVGNFKTDKDTVELEIFRYHEMSGKLWWLFSLLFFIVSVFGIFDMRLDRHGICIKYKSILHLKEKSKVCGKVRGVAVVQPPDRREKSGGMPLRLRGGAGRQCVLYR